MKIKKILCPVDFSDNARYALDYACEFARMHGAGLEVLHVMIPPPSAIPDFAPMPAFPEELLKQYEETCRAELDRFLEKERECGIPLTIALRYETPFLGIIHEAHEKEVDLIVMGTHGRTGLRHALMGSVAEKVVRKAPCPVLTVRHPDHVFEMPGCGQKQ